MNSERTALPCVAASLLLALGCTSTAGPVQESSAAAAEVRRVLEDKDFLDACAHMEDTDTPTLEKLAQEAQSAVDARAGEAFIERADAGLYRPIPGYEPGKPFEMNLNEGDLLRSFYSSGKGDGNLVELPREDHPELYALWDAEKRLEAELRERAMKAARRAHRAGR